jgi:hypothetical protein
MAKTTKKDTTGATPPPAPGDPVTVQQEEANIILDNMSVNSLMESTLPSVYVKKIVLEQRDFMPEKTDNFLTPYVDEDSPSTEDLIQGLKKKQTFEEKLWITFNLAVKIPNIRQNDFLDFILNDDFIKYIKVYQAVFYNVGGRDLYKDILSSSAKLNTLKENINKYYLGDGSAINEYTDPAKGYSNVGLKVGKLDVHPYADQSKVPLKSLKTTLPNGAQVYEIPLTKPYNIDKLNPTNLATILFTSIDFNAMWEEFSDTMGSKGFSVPTSIVTNATSRATGEVIIKNGKIQKTGMMFVISQNQESVANNQRFGKYAGQPWLGGVHRHVAGGKVRYMAGDQHTPQQPHPYLDVLFTANNKIQDFRQVRRIQKEMVDFTAQENKIFGGDIRDLSRKRESLDKLAIFSPLLYSRVHPSQSVSGAEMFFGLDFGKLVKQYCAVPMLIDKMAAENNSNKLFSLLNSSRLLSLKIFRRRLDTAKNVTNEVGNKKLVYASDITGFQGSIQLKTHYSPQPYENTISSLYPVAMDSAITNLNGFYYHFTFNDHEKKVLATGEFEYSLEVEYTDPTVGYLNGIYQTILAAIDGDGAKDGLKQYFKKATLPGVFNSYLGTFESNFVNNIKAQQDIYTNKGVPKIVRSVLMDDELREILNLSTKNPISKDEFIKVITNMLDLTAATPDSIAATIQIFEMIADQLRRVINSFSTAKIPKVSAFGGSDATTQTATGVKASSGGKRIISHTHVFDTKVDVRGNDAGYDFLSDVKTSSIYGLYAPKTIALEDFVARVDKESRKYFTDDAVDKDSQLELGPLSTENFSTSAKAAVGNKEEIIPSTRISTSAYSYLTVPKMGTRLPAYIKNLVEENLYSKLIANIIRYKKGILGNYSGGEKIFTDPRMADQTASEFMFKMTQFFADQSVSFKQDKTLQVETVKNQPNTQMLSTPEGMLDSPKLGGQNAPVETQNLGAQPEVQKIAGQLGVPDLDLSNLMLSLFNGNEFLLNKTDIIEKEYDPSDPSSKFNRFMARAYSREGTQAISNLPNQLKALAMKYTNKTPLGLSIFAFFGGELALSRYGDFWFRHQNIVEVQYLSGYAPYDLGKATDAQTYEKKYGNSISSMEWKRVTPEILNQITAGKVILCRLHKYRNTLSNDKAYNMLDLPIYRQYFFIQGGLIDLPEELVALASAETATETPVLESSWVESEATEKTKQESAALTQGGGEGGSAQGVAGSMGAQAKATAEAAAKAAAEAAAAAVAAASENSGLTEEEVKEAVETGLLLAAAKKEEEEKKKSAQFAADVFGQSEEEQQEKASFALSVFGGDQSYDT